MNKEYVKDSHCSWCGSKFTEQTTWPRKCYVCWNESYKNPIPIVVSIIGVGEHGTSLLIQQRNIEPKKGEWALPSGYINFGESWQEAAVRENKEEMNFDSVPEDYELWGIKRPLSGNMLIFCKYKRLIYKEPILQLFKPNEEVIAIDFYMGNSELAFPTHNECVKEYFDSIYSMEGFSHG
jgi:hypothetical protein